MINIKALPKRSIEMLENRSKIIRLNHVIFSLSLAFFSACVEPFEFESQSESPVVIVEGFVSDVSSQDYESMFGKPRYFHVKLKYAGAVKNNIDLEILGAEIVLVSDQNENWDFTEDANQPGTYYLYHPSFASQPNVKYKVNIQLANGEEYESDFDQMPTQNVKGEINDEESTKFKHVVKSQKLVLRNFKGLDVNIQMPSFSDDSIRYYRWDFHTTWMLVAELLPRTHPQGVCWVDEVYYLDENIIARQKGKAANVKLFFLQTSGNQETKFGFAVRIRQQGISREYHQFWADLHNQEKQADLFAPPPYNVFSNIHAVGQPREVFGFFGVVNEEYYTWYFDKLDLSYNPYYIDECIVNFPVVPAEWCGYCLAKDGLKKGDNITDTQPMWWTF